jgi:hypothetical protein
MQYASLLVFSILVLRVLVMSMLVLDVLRLSVLVLHMLMIGMLMLNVRLRLCGRSTWSRHSSSAVTNVASEVSGGVDTIGQNLPHGMWSSPVHVVQRDWLLRIRHVAMDWSCCMVRRSNWDLSLNGMREVCLFHPNFSRWRSGSWHESYVPLWLVWKLCGPSGSGGDLTVRVSAILAVPDF